MKTRIKGYDETKTGPFNDPSETVTLGSDTGWDTVVPTTMTLTGTCGSYGTTLFKTYCKSPRSPRISLHTTGPRSSPRIFLL